MATADKLALLKATKADLKAALTEQGQTPGDVFETYPDLVRAIETGIDTSDATATAADMASGVTAYVNGEKVTGNVYTFAPTTGTWADIVPTAEYEGTSSVPSRILMNFPFDYDLLMRKGSYVLAKTEPSNFGDATAADVAAGKTFTSAAGLAVEGTATVGDTMVVDNFSFSVSNDLVITTSKPVDWSRIVMIAFGAGEVNTSVNYKLALQGNVDSYYGNGLNDIRLALYVQNRSTNAIVACMVGSYSSSMVIEASGNKVTIHIANCIGAQYLSYFLKTGVGQIVYRPA